LPTAGESGRRKEEWSTGSAVLSPLRLATMAHLCAAS
jgi:hypothetical protein